MIIVSKNKKVKKIFVFVFVIISGYVVINLMKKEMDVKNIVTNVKNNVTQKDVVMNVVMN